MCLRCRDDIAFLLVEDRGPTEGRGRVVRPAGALVNLGECNKRIAVRVEEVTLLGKGDCIARECLRKTTYTPLNLMR